MTNFHEKRTQFIAIISILLLTFVGYWFIREPTLPPETQQVQTELMLFSSVPLALSPDDRLILEKNMALPKRLLHHLKITDVSTGKALYSFQSSGPALRTAWRPDSRAISYFLQDKETNRRRLFIWDLDADIHREVTIPISYAQAIVRWSPDSRQLAFTSSPDGLLICNPNNGEIITIPDAVQFFDWSKDSQSLAVIPEDEPDSVRLIEAKSGKIIKTLHPLSGNKFLGLSWARSSRLLLLSSAQEANETKTVRTFTAIDPASQAAETLLQTTLPASSPNWLSDGAGILWHQGAPSGDKKVVMLPHEGKEPKALASQWTADFRSFSQDGSQVIMAMTTPAVYQLIKSPLNGETTIVIAESPGARRFITDHQMISIDSAYGQQPFQVIVSSIANRTEAANAAVIRIHGNSIILAGQPWTETQLYLNRGIDVIHVGTRQSHGAEDLLAACDYAHTTLKIPTDRIVVIGASTAATVALEAALQRPKAFGTLVLIGLMNMPETMMKSPLEVIGPYAMVFHGGKDRIAPASRSREIIEKTLGTGSLSNPKGSWKVFPNEDHTLHQPESQAVVHASILQRLNHVKP